MDVFGMKSSQCVSYRDIIEQLVKNSPLNIDTNIEMSGRIPTSASSEFITNKEQGDWAENIIFETINSYSSDYIAVHYGRNDNLSAGDEGFKEFYETYLHELNTIGKRPDILIFKRSDIHEYSDLADDVIGKAVCALEVRSSSFLSNKYEEFMTSRHQRSLDNIKNIRNAIINNNILSGILMKKNKVIFDYLKKDSEDGYSSFPCRVPSWHSSEELKQLSRYLKEIKENIEIIQRRDYLSITPKLEDIALVNRWIQRYNVPHYYVQVFFDKAYIISFKDILGISSDINKKETVFSIEKDNKNQGKTTIKININFTDLFLYRIDMPEHCSQIKEFDRGRLLFYVKFSGGKGYLNESVFSEVVK